MSARGIFSSPLSITCAVSYIIRSLTTFCTDINSWNSVYQGNYYKYVGVQVHEIGEYM